MRRIAFYYTKVSHLKDLKVVLRKGKQNFMPFIKRSKFFSSDIIITETRLVCPNFGHPAQTSDIFACQVYI